METLDTVNLPMFVAGLTLTALALVAALVLMRRRRRVPAPAVVEAKVAEVEEITEVADDDSITVRALRAQVRALEQALEVAPESSLPAVVLPSGDEAGYRRRVLLAVRAVASRTGDSDEPRHAAARVVAAVERLDVDGFTRPVLPGIASRTIAVPPPLPPVLPAPAAPLPAAPVPTARPEIGRVDDTEVVVPVPPPAVEEPRRSRRRLRRHAASDAA
jgi:hypothetical protein